MCKTANSNTNIRLFSLKKNKKMENWNLRKPELHLPTIPITYFSELLNDLSVKPLYMIVSLTGSTIYIG